MRRLRLLFPISSGVSILWDHNQAKLFIKMLPRVLKPPVVSIHLLTLWSTSRRGSLGLAQELLGYLRGEKVPILILDHSTVSSERLNDSEVGYSIFNEYYYEYYSYFVLAYGFL